MTESLPEGHQELTFEFDFSIDPVAFIGDNFKTYCINDNLYNNSFNGYGIFIYTGITL